MTRINQRRFDELLKQLEQLEAYKTTRYNSYYEANFTYVDGSALLEWRVKAKSLLSNVCGEQSQHFLEFQENEKASFHSTNYDVLKRLRAVFLAAKEDFESGYLLSTRTLVQAEVFDSELEQASELLDNGYRAAAAVIAGVVLETALRELCDQNSISHGKLDKMNADLTKAGVYNILVQKRITALADVRNKAAHGKSNEFTQQDVTDMIRDVGRFLLENLQSS